MANCKHCGAQLKRENARFCSQCGGAQDISTAPPAAGPGFAPPPPTAVPASPPEPVLQPQPEAPEAPVDQADPVAEPEERETAPAPEREAFRSPDEVLAATPESLAKSWTEEAAKEEAATETGVGAAGEFQFQASGEGQPSPESLAEAWNGEAIQQEGALVGEFQFQGAVSGPAPESVNQSGTGGEEALNWTQDSTASPTASGQGGATPEAGGPGGSASPWAPGGASASSQPAPQTWEGAQQATPAQHTAPQAADELPHYQPPAAAGAPGQQAAQPPKKKGKGLLVAVILILVVLLGAGGTFGALYISNRPDKFIGRFSAALSTMDVGYLSTVVSTSGGDATEAELLALCSAFADPSDMEKLRNSLTDQARGLSAGPSVNAIQLDSSPYLVFFRKYEVYLSQVTLVVKSDVEDYVLMLDGEELEGNKRGGTLELRLTPGAYQLEGTVSTPYSDATARVATPPALSASEDTEVQLDFGLFDISVVCDAQEDVTITVNNIETDLKLENGQVVVPAVQVGMAVRGSIVRDGKTITDEIQVLGQEGYALTFGDPEPKKDDKGSDTGAIPEDDFLASYTEDELNAMVAEYLYMYYNSYIDAINYSVEASDLADWVYYITDNYMKSLPERVDRNRGTFFLFYNLSIDLDTVQYKVVDDVKTVEFVAQFFYEYAEADSLSNWEEGSSIQTVQMVFNDDNHVWLVNDTNVNNSLKLGDNLLNL